MLKRLIFGNPFLLNISAFLYSFLGCNRFRVSSQNTLSRRGAFLKKTKVVLAGHNNRVIISPKTHLTNLVISIHGNGNTIFIGEKVSASRLEIVIDEDGNEVKIGEGTVVSGRTHLACIEGTKILIGSGCLFSANIVCRTGDSHSIMDMDGNRINPSKMICIGNHVWIGNGATLLKGASVGNDCVVGTGSIITKSFEDSNVILAGSPAKIVKRDIQWDEKRL